MEKIVEISYSRGDIKLVREPEVLKEKDSKAHNLGKNSQQRNDNVNEVPPKILFVWSFLGCA